MSITWQSAIILDMFSTTQVELVHLVRVTVTKAFLGSNGANGGIKPTGSLSVPAVRLYPFLQSQYSDQALANVCVLKIDTEGHDVVILADLPAQFRPPVIWVEWFREYQFADITKYLLEVKSSSKQSFRIDRMSQNEIF